MYVCVRVTVTSSRVEINAVRDNDSEESTHMSQGSVFVGGGGGGGRGKVKLSL
jgi:hypothetical protein